VRSIQQYVSSISTGFKLAHEIRDYFITFLNDWGIWAVPGVSLEPLIKLADAYVGKLESLLSEQQSIAMDVLTIIANVNSNDPNLHADAVKISIFAISLELSLLKIACKLHAALFRRDEVNKRIAILTLRKKLQPSSENFSRRSSG
jgi:hypothetical protein